MLRVSRRYHWHHYQSLFFSIRNGSAFFVMSFRYATRLKLCLLLINWGFVDPWKNLSAEIMHVLSFFLSFDINWDHIQRRRCSFRQYFENLFSVIYAINLVFLIWHNVIEVNDILATKPYARDIFVSFFHAFEELQIWKEFHDYIYLYY